MFERILFPTDGSECSDRAFQVVEETALRFGSEVVVLHVHEHEMSWMETVELETAAESLELADGHVRALKDKSVHARGEVRNAPHALVAREIVELASKENVGLIVMGTHGLSTWQRLLIGSVAQKVLHHATCPVLLVR